MNKEEGIKKYGRHWESSENFCKHMGDKETDPDFIKKVETLARARYEHNERIQERIRNGE